MAKQTLTRCEVRYDSTRKCWIFRERWDGKWDESGFGARKADLLRDVAIALKARVKEGEYGFSLRIYGKNGRVQDERSYGHDPRKSKG